MFAAVILRETLYLIEILHQTTTFWFWEAYQLRCILLKFYIKPQPASFPSRLFRVVSYWNSTSNHNGGSRYSDWLEVVSYWNSTSNHNNTIPQLAIASVVSYWNSTSNHNTETTFSQEPCVVSYWNSTSNHNEIVAISTKRMLYLIEILHQTTTFASSLLLSCCCILLKFYIKPQHRPNNWRPRSSCILLKFYIKPQHLAVEGYS